MDSEFILLELGCVDPELGQTENLLRMKLNQAERLKEEQKTYLLICSTKQMVTQFKTFSRLFCQK